jgi:hypothetical protein
MPNTYVALDTKTISTTVASVTFTSIPSGYTDLILVADATTAVANGSITLQFNGDTSTNYSYTALYGTGSAAGSLRASNAAIIGFLGYAAQVPVGTRAMGIAQIQNYSNTTTNKTVLIRNTPAVSSTVEAAVGLWRSTAAINSITVLPISGASIGANSTFTLYGVANADQGSAKATGGIITEDSQYWYHTFGATGAFIPKQSLSCDILVVAGGGSGGNFNAGGGGAGGVLTHTSQSLTATNYTVTVGAGGAGTTSGGATSNGTNSQFAALTASVGGGGGGWFTGGASLAGQNGGCGGGGMGGAGSSSLLVGTGSQGFNGGTGSSSGSGNGGGGGGGMGAVGGNATNGADTGGNGGAGVTSTFINEIGAVTGVGFNSSGAYYLAGGGGGGGYNAAGAGGIGGGGIGGLQSVAGGNGQVTTGSGGGGARNGSALSGSGGSGVVIVRYAK